MGGGAPEAKVGPHLVLVRGRSPLPCPALPLPCPALPCPALGCRALPCPAGWRLQPYCPGGYTSVRSPSGGKGCCLPHCSSAMALWGRLFRQRRRCICSATLASLPLMSLQPDPTEDGDQAQ